MIESLKYKDYIQSISNKFNIDLSTIDKDNLDSNIKDIDNRIISYIVNKAIDNLDIETDEGTSMAVKQTLKNNIHLLHDQTMISCDEDNIIIRFDLGSENIGVIDEVLSEF